MLYISFLFLSLVELGDMSEWDENTLRSILKKKEAGRPPNASQQVCFNSILVS
jgi:hypothetical protein